MVRSLRRSADPGTRTDVLVVVSAADRRGAELEGAALAAQLNIVGRRADCVALAHGSGALEGVDILGREPLSLSTLRALRRRAQNASVAIAVGSHTLPACAIALTGLSTPFIYRSIGNPASWVRGPVHRRRTRLLFRRAEHVVALWPGAAEDLVRLYRLDSDEVSTVPNARDADHFLPPDDSERRAARQAWGVDDECPLVVALGALTAEKQVDRAIQAMALLPDARLMVVGDGPECPRLAALADAAPSGNVTIVGPVSDPKQVLHAADVLVMTSRTEGMPGVIIEAGLTGVPSVAPAVGAIGEMIVDGVSGVVVPTDAPTAVALGIRTALAHHHQLGTGARTLMRSRYTWDVVLPTWLETLDGVRARRHGAARAN